mgnify:CR=1 FL=1
MSKELVVKLFTTDYLTLIAPVLLMSALVEYFVFRKSKIHSFNESIANTYLGIMNQIVFLICRTTQYFIYFLIYKNWAILDLYSLSAIGFAITTIFALFFWDFLHYWAHRVGHVTKIGWAFHSPHHQSNEFNLTIAFRNGMMQQIFEFSFYIPLAILGIPPEVYICISGFSLFIQFISHAHWFPNLGPLEKLFNVPRHHIVHHASNPCYLDKNFSGGFIIWDKLFGTYKELDPNVPPIFGTTIPYHGYGPLESNLHEFKILLGLQNTKPERAFHSLFSDRVFSKAHILTHFSVLLFLVVKSGLVLGGAQKIDFSLRIILSIFTVFCMSLLGKALSGKGSRLLEFLRLLSTSVVFLFLIQKNTQPAAGLISVVFAYYLIFHLVQVYSYLSASIVSIWAALRAGQTPNNTPVTNEIENAGSRIQSGARILNRGTSQLTK